MGQIWPTQPTRAQLSWVGIPSNRGVGEPRCAAVLTESGGLPMARGVGVATRVGRRCGGTILRLGEDRGSPERAHDGDSGRAEEFTGTSSVEWWGLRMELLPRCSEVARCLLTPWPSRTSTGGGCPWEALSRQHWSKGAAVARAGAQRSSGARAGFRPRRRGAGWGVWIGATLMSTPNLRYLGYKTSTCQNKYIMIKILIIKIIKNK
jgi:hypothetical protein